MIWLHYYVNLVNFGPVTPEFMNVKDVTQWFLSSK